MRDPRLHRKPEDFGILVALSGSFVAALRTESLHDFQHGSEFVSEDYAGRARLLLGLVTFDLNWDQVYKEPRKSEQLVCDIRVRQWSHMWR